MKALRPPVAVPLLGYACALMLGVVAARQGWWGAGVDQAIIILAVIGAGAFLLLPQWRDKVWTIRHWRWGEGKITGAAVATGCTLIGFGGLGALRYELAYNRLPQGHIFRYTEAEGYLATLEGRIVTEPVVAAGTGPLARYDFLHGPATLFVLECERLKNHRQAAAVCGRVQVAVREPDFLLRAGQRVEVAGRIYRRGGLRNPGEYDRTDRYRASGVLVACTVEFAEALIILEQRTERQGIFAAVQAQLRGWANSALMEDSLSSALELPPAQSAGAEANPGAPAGGDLAENPAGPNRQEMAVRGYLAALFLGERRGVPNELNEAFMRTGTIHVLSVSGMHMSLLAAFAWGLATLLRLPRWARGVLALAAILTYMIIVPAEPPLIRSGLMCLVFCVAYMARRTSDSLNVLAFAVIVNLLLQPIDLFNAGFQLSYLVVLGIMVFAGPLYRGELFAEELELRVRRSLQVEAEHRPWWQTGLLYLGRSIWAAGAVSLVAWLVGLPLTAWHFHRIAPWGMVASVILALPISATMLLGFAKLLLAPILPWAAGFFAWPLEVASSWTIHLNSLLAGLPYSSIPTASPPAWWIAIFYLVLLGLAWALWRLNEFRRPLVLALLAGLIAFAVLAPFRPASSRDMTLTLLSVGPGCAAVVELPDGRTVQYDAGSLTNFNLGRNTLAPFLRTRGVGRLDGLFLSHPNIDHYNGVPDLAELYPIGQVFRTGYFPAQEPPPGPVAETLRILQSKNVPLRTLAAGDSLQGVGYRLEVLWPPPRTPAWDLSENDSALVLRVSTGRGSILFCGDIGEVPQRLLLERYPPARLQADVLVLPHHGAVTPALGQVVQAVNPRYILNTSGRMTESRLLKLRQALGGRELHGTSAAGALQVVFQNSPGREAGGCVLKIN